MGREDPEALKAGHDKIVLSLTANPAKQTCKENLGCARREGHYPATSL